jgi:putative hydrolase of the HAD superfamily
LVQLGIDSYFSFKLFSDEIGYSKPNPLAYKTMYQNVLSLKPTIEKHQILHVGDNPIADLQGAENFGINGKLLLPNMVISHLFK